LVALVSLVLAESVRNWVHVATGRKAAVVKESPFVRTQFVEERG